MVTVLDNKTVTMLKPLQIIVVIISVLFKLLWGHSTTMRMSSIQPEYHRVMTAQSAVISCYVNILTEDIC